MSSDSGEFESCSDDSGEEGGGGAGPPALPSRAAPALPPTLPSRAAIGSAFEDADGGDDDGEGGGPPLLPAKHAAAVIEPSGVNYAPFKMMSARDEDGETMFADHCWGQPPAKLFDIRGPTYTECVLCAAGGRVHARMLRYTREVHCCSHTVSATLPATLSTHCPPRTPLPNLPSYVYRRMHRHSPPALPPPPVRTHTHTQ